MKKVCGKDSRTRHFAPVLAILFGLCVMEAGVLAAADSTTLGGIGGYNAVKTTCHDLSTPTVAGYYIGDSDFPIQNDVAPKNSATKWCEENGYSFGFAKNMFWSGDGPCMIYPHGTGGGDAWGLAHHCYAILTIRCCY